MQHGGYDMTGLVRAVLASVGATVLSGAALAQGVVPGAPINPAVSANESPPYERVVAGEEIPLSEVAMIFYQQVLGAERRQGGSGQKMLRDTLKLDESTSSAFMDFMASALDRSNEHRHEVKARLVCSRLNDLTAAPELSAALQGVDESIKTRHASLVDESARVLGSDNKQAVDHHVSRMRSGMVISEIDWVRLVEFMAEGGSSATQVASEFCR